MPTRYFSEFLAAVSCVFSHLCLFLHCIFLSHCRLSCSSHLSLISLMAEKLAKKWHLGCLVPLLLSPVPYFWTSLWSLMTCHASTFPATGTCLWSVRTATCTTESYFDHTQCSWKSWRFQFTVPSNPSLSTLRNWCINTPAPRFLQWNSLKHVFQWESILVAYCRSWSYKRPLLSGFLSIPYFSIVPPKSTT